MNYCPRCHLPLPHAMAWLPTCPFCGAARTDTTFNLDDGRLYKLPDGTEVVPSMATGRLYTWTEWKTRRRASYSIAVDGRILRQGRETGVNVSRLVPAPRHGGTT